MLSTVCSPPPTFHRERVCVYNISLFYLGSVKKNVIDNRPKRMFCLQTFCPSGHFVPPDVLSLRTFCLRTFCLRMFCPYGRFVSGRFVWAPFKQLKVTQNSTLKEANYIAYRDIFKQIYLMKRIEPCILMIF
jgi:hypothetical protein